MEIKIAKNNQDMLNKKNAGMACSEIYQNLFQSYGY